MSKNYPDNEEDIRWTQQSAGRNFTIFNDDVIYFGLRFSGHLVWLREIDYQSLWPSLDP